MDLRATQLVGDAVQLELIDERHREELRLAADHDRIWEHTRIARAEPAEPDPLEVGFGARAGPGAHLIEREPDVVAHAQPRQQRGRLEHDAAVGAGAVDLAAGDRDAAGRRQIQPHQDRQHGGLPAAGVTEQADELALRDLQREVAHDDGRAVRGVVRLAQLGDLDEPWRQHQAAGFRQPRRNSTIAWRAF